MILCLTVEVCMPPGPDIVAACASTTLSGGFVPVPVALLLHFQMC
jgi:hypothetical protein